MPINKFLETAREFTTLLLSYHIPFQVENSFDGYRWTFSFFEGSVILHSLTAKDENYVESCYFPWDEDDTNAFKPQEMAQKIARLYADLT